MKEKHSERWFLFSHVYPGLGIFTGFQIIKLLNNITIFGLDRLDDRLRKNNSSSGRTRQESRHGDGAFWGKFQVNPTSQYTFLFLSVFPRYHELINRYQDLNVQKFHFYIIPKLFSPAEIFSVQRPLLDRWKIFPGLTSFFNPVNLLLLHLYEYLYQNIRNSMICISKERPFS